MEWTHQTKRTYLLPRDTFFRSCASKPYLHHTTLDITFPFDHVSKSIYTVECHTVLNISKVAMDGAEKGNTSASHASQVQPEMSAPDTITSSPHYSW